MRYILTFVFENGQQHSTSVDSDLSLEQVNVLTQSYLEGRSPIPNLVINREKLLFIRIDQDNPPQVNQESLEG